MLFCFYLIAVLDSYLIFCMDFYFRFWRVLKLGFKSRRTKSHDDLEAVYSANNDVCLLRLFESFLESAPQLTLQLYIIITFQHFDWILGKTSHKISTVL